MDNAYILFIISVISISIIIFIILYLLYKKFSDDTIPQATTPETITTQYTTPETITTQATTPETITTQATTPETITTQYTTPETITTQYTTPQATTPQATTPQATTPQATILQSNTINMCSRINKTYVDLSRFPDYISAFYDFSYTNLGVDSSGNKNDCVVIKGERGCDEIKQFSCRILKDGYIDISQLIVQSVYHGISLWFRTSNVGTVNLISFNNYIEINIVNGNIFIQQGTLDIISLLKYNDDKWHHLLFQFADNYGEMYIDNKLEFITTFIKSKDYSQILIGKDGYDGYITDILVFNTKLSKNTVSEIYKDNYGYDVFALLGQSNMVGLGQQIVGRDDNYDIIKGRVYEVPFDLNNLQEQDENGQVLTHKFQDPLIIREARNPLDFNTRMYRPAFKRGGYEENERTDLKNSTGIWKSFTENILSRTHTKRKILLIPAAKAGSGFVIERNDINASWNKDDGIYKAAVDLINIVSNKEMNKLQAILWLQGETDKEDGKMKEKLIELDNNFTNDIKEYNANIPFIAGGIIYRTAITQLTEAQLNSKSKPKIPILSSNTTERDRINKGIQEFVSLGTKRYYVDNNAMDLTRLVNWGEGWKDDLYHMDGESLFKSGKEYAKKYIESLTNKFGSKIAMPSTYYNTTKWSEWTPNGECILEKGLYVQPFKRKCESESCLGTNTKNGRCTSYYNFGPWSKCEADTLNPNKCIQKIKLTCKENAPSECKDKLITTSCYRCCRKIKDKTCTFLGIPCECTV